MITKQVTDFNEFKKELVANEGLQEQFKQDPINAVQQFQEKSPLDTDKWIYRIIVLALGITIVAIIIGVLILIGKGLIKKDDSVPTILTAIGSAAIGALAGLLAPSPKAKSS